MQGYGPPGTLQDHYAQQHQHPGYPPPPNRDPYGGYPPGPSNHSLPPPPPQHQLPQSNKRTAAQSILNDEDEDEKPNSDTASQSGSGAATTTGTGKAKGGASEFVKKLYR